MAKAVSWPQRQWQQAKTAETAVLLLLRVVDDLELLGGLRRKNSIPR